MEESYIKDYIVNLLDNTYGGDLEGLKAIAYGLEHILNNLEYKQENVNDIKNYNSLTSCYIKIKEIIKEYDDQSNIPLF